MLEASESVIFNFLERAVDVALSNSTLNSSNSSPSDSEEYLELEYLEDNEEVEDKVDDADVVEEIDDAKIRFSLSSSNGDEDIVGRDSAAAIFSSLITLFLGMDLGTLEVEMGKDVSVVEEEEEVVVGIEEDAVEEMDVETEGTVDKEEVDKESFVSTFSETEEREWESKAGLEGFLVDVEVKEVCLRVFTA